MSRLYNQETIPKYPKIWHIGSDFIPNLFDGEIEVTEKIDGSAFAFGISKDGELVMRSKGRQIDPMMPDAMFQPAVDWVLENEEKIRNELFSGEFVYGEYLSGPCHNVLKYDRIPNNHIMVYGAYIGDKYVDKYDDLEKVARYFNLETVPLMFRGLVDSDHTEFVKSMLDKDAILGGCKAEGIVIKNYGQPCIIGSHVQPSFGKLVTEAFKETHDKDWSIKFKSASQIESLLWSYHAEARWEKAYQHLRDDGKLENQLRDIPKIIEEVKRDLIEEEKENIKEQLYKIYIGDILKRSCVGLPEWLKIKMVGNTQKNI